MRGARLRAASGRAAWGLGDQVFSSATNFAVNILIARSLGAATFGAFSIAFAAYIVFLSLSRAVNAEPMTIRYSNIPEGEWRIGAGRASATTLAIGVLSSLICLGVSAAVDGDLRASFLALAVTLPGLLHLDMWRFSFFARGKGHLSMLADVLWAVFMIPPFALILAADEPSLFLLAVAWGGSATLAGLTVAIPWGVRPAFTRIREWLSDHRDLTPHFVGEMATISGAGQVAVVGIGLVASLAAVGAYRATYVLFGPLRVIYQGLTLFGVPEAVRVFDESPQRLRRVTRVGAVILAVIALAYGLFLILIPDAWGEFILGDTWALAEPLAVPFTIGVVGVGISMPTYIGLRVLERAKDTFRTRMIVTGFDSVFTIAGAALGGALGAAWAGRGFLFLGSGLWWRVYEKRLREQESRSPVSAGEGRR